MAFPEKAGKQKTECLGWGVGNIIKPTMPSNPVCLGICLVSMQTTLLQTPTKTQVCLDTIKMEILQEYSQVNVQPQASNSLLDFVIGFPGVQYPLHQAALLEQLWGKGRIFRIFQRTVDPPAPSLAAPQELQAQPFPCPAPPWLFPRGSQQSSSTCSIPRLDSCSSSRN